MPLWRREGPPLLPDGEAWRRRFDRWLRRPRVGSALDLVGSAIVLGDVDAAQELLAWLGAQGVAQDRVGRVVAWVNRGAIDRVRHSTEESTGEWRQRIGVLKSLLRQDPRDALRWCDVALAYAALGQEGGARSAMRMATALAGSNRLILRNAVRMFAHFEDPEMAARMLRGWDHTREDPWLLAALYSVEDLTEQRRTSRRVGVRLVESRRHSPRQTSELSAAIATDMLGSGEDRRARTWFRGSLESPTENSLAQVEWANSRIGGLSTEIELTRGAESGEALSWMSLHDEQWEDALKQSLVWRSLEPFASQPAIVASYVCGSLLGRHLDAIPICEAGLRANPRDLVLLNNLAFSLLSAGQVRAGLEVLERVGQSRTELPVDIALTATRGLAEYRQGRAGLGRVLYSEAVDLAVTRRNQSAAAIAKGYWAREEARENRSEATKLMADARATLPPGDDWQGKRVLDVIEEEIREVVSQGVGPQPDGGRG